MLHHICSTKNSFDLRCESFTVIVAISLSSYVVTKSACGQYLGNHKVINHILPQPEVYNQFTADITHSGEVEL